MLRGLLLLILLNISVFCFSQNRDSVLSSSKKFFLHRIVIDGDTIPHVSIREVKIVPRMKFKSKRRRRHYNRLVINIKKTLPYARLAKKRLDEISAALDTIKGERQKKIYIKAAEKKLFKEFEAPLRKLTFSQGRMLIKLIDRETGNTSYNLIKELKGNFSAFMWQSVARIFGSNLKSEFDSNGDDFMIEHIIILIDDGVL